MIIAQTPLRLSFFSGGTDFPSYYASAANAHGGAVVGVSIDKYIFVIVKERFDDKIYINYSQKEIVDTVDQVQHELVREAMRPHRGGGGVEITTLADVPSEGSGLGSSSAVTVGLLQALWTFRGDPHGGSARRGRVGWSWRCWGALWVCRTPTSPPWAGCASSSSARTTPPGSTGGGRAAPRSGSASSAIACSSSTPTAPASRPRS